VRLHQTGVIGYDTHAEVIHAAFPAETLPAIDQRFLNFTGARIPEIELCEVVSIKATIVRKQSVGMQSRVSSNEKVRNDPATAAPLI
jgi:hypothetical protein